MGVLVERMLRGTTASRTSPNVWRVAVKNRPSDDRGCYRMGKLLESWARLVKRVHCCRTIMQYTLFAFGQQERLCYSPSSSSTCTTQFTSFRCSSAFGHHVVSHHAPCMSANSITTVLDAIAYEWLATNYPQLVQAIDTELSNGSTPSDVRFVVQQHSGADHDDLALRCEQAARHILALRAKATA